MLTFFYSHITKYSYFCEYLFLLSWEKPWLVLQLLGIFWDVERGDALPQAATSPSLFCGADGWWVPPLLGLAFDFWLGAMIFPKGPLRPSWSAPEGIT